ncbi:B-4DMT family transporter [Rhodococcus sp. (in: high G+C Gram-positive bacteria)]|uniref:B-4DMT family transporter n=1 Tax=Rhodococcus sp. TaxID=1831 RepID=UPI0038906A32
MKPWLVRGLGLSLVHVVVRALLGAALMQWPLQGSILRWLGLAVVILAAVVWAGIDGIRDRRAYPDPDDGEDLTMRWLAAGAVTGIVAGFLTWLVDTLTDIPIGVKSILFELTSGAAFTVLLVFLPAMAAVTAGRFFAGRGEKTDESDRPASRQQREPATVASAPAADPAWRTDDAPTEVFPAVDPHAPRPER